MGQTIQQIPLGEISAYLIDFDENSLELSFRRSDAPDELRKEKVILKKEIVEVPDEFHFHISLLEKFKNSN